MNKLKVIYGFKNYKIIYNKNMKQRKNTCGTPETYTFSDCREQTKH